MTALITVDLVDIDLATKDRAEATRALAQRVVDAGRATDLGVLLEDLAAREAQMPTGLEGGIGIPHARSAAVTVPTLAFGRSAPGIDWGASDGPAHLIFLIAVPAAGGDEHMRILAKLARKLVNPAFRASLLDAANAEAVVEIIAEVTS